MSSIVCRNGAMSTGIGNPDRGDRYERNVNLLVKQWKKVFRSRCAVKFCRASCKLVSSE